MSRFVVSLADMADSPKRRNFVYKVATFLKESGDENLTLQKLLKDAIGKAPKALDRAQNPEADGVGFRFLNYSGTHVISQSAHALFGCEFLGFEKGADQSTININPEAEQVDVGAITAQQGQEFLGGSIYFGVIDNHVVLVQSQAYRALDLEKYLNWFLVEKVKVLGADNRVGLADHTPGKSKTQYQDVKGIEIEAPVHLRPLVVVEKGKKTAKKIDGKAEKSVAVKMGGKAWDAVKVLFGEGFDLPTELRVEDAMHAPNLDLKIYLSWKGAKRDDGSDFLDAIAKNMSHVDDEFDYTVHTSSGAIGKKDFKLFHAHSVKWSKGRPQFDDLFPKMSLWLASLIESGKIEA